MILVLKALIKMALHVLHAIQGVKLVNLKAFVIPVLRVSRLLLTIALVQQEHCIEVNVLVNALTPMKKIKAV